MHKFLVCAYNSQYFAQTPENFAQSHDCETRTFRNSAYYLFYPLKCRHGMCQGFTYIICVFLTDPVYIYKQLCNSLIKSAMIC